MPSVSVTLTRRWIPSYSNVVVISPSGATMLDELCELPMSQYDPLGSVLTKQTANMAEKGKMIAYTYDYHRLTGISYPDHPENNVKY